jgi:hypothetical protein
MIKYICMYSKNKKTKLKYYRTRIFQIGVVLLIILLATSSKKTASAADQSTSHTDLSPATAQDKKEVEQHKDDLAKQQGQQAPTPASSSVVPVITFSRGSQTLEVGSYVPGIVEDGGTCKLTAVKASTTVISQSTGVRNATNTNCTFSVQRSKFPTSGDWIITVSYASATTQTGSSQSQEVNIP